MEKNKYPFHEIKEFINKIKPVEKRFSLYPGLKEQEKKKIEKEHSVKTPTALADFYAQSDCFNFKWLVKDTGNPNRLIGGLSGFRLFSYLYTNSVLFLREGKPYFDVFFSANLTGKEKDYFNTFYILEDLKEKGYYTLFKIKKDIQDPDIYLFIPPDKCFPMKISFKKYMECLFKVRGLQYWHYYMVDDKEFDINAEIPDDFYGLAKRYVPDADLDDFKVNPSLKNSVYSTFFTKEKTDYRLLFDEKVKELKANQNFSKIKYKPNYGVDIGVLRRVKRSIGRDLPESMMEFYCQMNGFTLNWQYKDDQITGPVKGSVVLPPLEEVFGGESGMKARDWDDNIFKNILWFEYMEEEEPEVADTLKKCKRVEQLPEVSESVVIEFQANRKEPRIYFLRKADLFPLKVNFRQYINAMLLTMGLDCWQFFLTDRSFKIGEQDRKDFFENMNRLFPEADLKLFRKG